MSLRIYPVSLQLVRAVGPLLSRLRGYSPSLGDQLERSLTSVPLNIAEGEFSRGKIRHARYHSAAGSAREAWACLETAVALGWLDPIQPEVESLFNHVIGTLLRIVAPKR
jgi:four helix bundle protein